jgi:signal transduction histidine kinase
MSDAGTDAAVDRATGKLAVEARRLIWPGGLSARLLLLTAVFALAAGLLILAPTLASYQEARFVDRIRAGELVTLAVETAPARTVSSNTAARLLAGAGVDTVAVQRGGVRSLLLGLEAPQMPSNPELVDLRTRHPVAWLTQPFRTLFGSNKLAFRVVARPRFTDWDFVEVVVPNGPLKRELAAYLMRIVWIVGFISLVAGAVLYLALNSFLVRPIQKMTAAMERFRVDPEDPGAHIARSGRRDEIGRAEAELDRMQTDVRTALASRARLAALGEAVAKINHDLRNMLTSAQIASERLAMIGDPRVSQALPRLERALDRAVTLASDVLSYGKSREAAPQKLPVLLRPALEAAAEDAALAEGGMRLETGLDEREQVLADPEQLHRILVNLLRNAREAILAAPEPRAGRVRVGLMRLDGDSIIRLSDNGPGVPERALARLFQPFAGSGRAEGAGLGLAISRELAQNHGGDLVLAENGPSGATFELRLPGVVEPAAERPQPGAEPSAPPGAVSRSARPPRAADRPRPRAGRRAP